MKRFVVWNNYGVRTYKFINLFMIDSIQEIKLLGKDTKIKIRHPIDKGIFCEIDKNITESDITKSQETFSWFFHYIHALRMNRPFSLADTLSCYFQIWYILSAMKYRKE